MGAAFRDFDNDGRSDIFLTALKHETYPLYRNLGGGLLGILLSVASGSRDHGEFRIE